MITRTTQNIFMIQASKELRERLNWALFRNKYCLNKNPVNREKGVFKLGDRCSCCNKII